MKKETPVTGGRTSKVGSVSWDFFCFLFLVVKTTLKPPKHKNSITKSDFFAKNYWKYFDLFSKIFSQNFKDFGQKKKKTADFTRFWQNYTHKKILPKQKKKGSVRPVKKKSFYLFFFVALAPIGRKLLTVIRTVNFSQLSEKNAYFPESEIYVQKGNISSHIPKFPFKNQNFLGMSFPNFTFFTTFL